MESSDGNRIQVSVRCRPFNARESAECGESELAVQFTGNTIKCSTGKTTYSYDHVFTIEDGQEAIFQAAGLQLLENALDAYNGCILAYGQTGSGKSHSMVGDVTSDAEKGILPRACLHLFTMISERSTKDSCFLATVFASYLEIYNEKVFDLLSGGGRGELQVRSHPQFGAIVPNLTECPVKSFSEIFDLLDFGAKKRAVGVTQMNATSSRSHAVFTIQIRMTVDQKGKSVERQANVYFVDLAGSERQKKTGAAGDRLKEGIGINQSLTTLGRVISELTKSGAKGVPPFRDSKLTLLLKDALMGNSRTQLLACISPSPFNLEETVSTLEFASRCKLVKTHAKRNEQSKVDVIAKLTNEKESIETQLEQEKARSEALCKQLQEELEKAAEKQRTTDSALEEKRNIEEQLRKLKISKIRKQKSKEVQPSEQSDKKARLPELGSRVVLPVELLGADVYGTVRYIGPVKDKSGDYIGVELDEAKGKNDGCVQDERLFTCEQGHGLFLRPPMVTLVSSKTEGDTPPSPKAQNSLDDVDELHQRLAEIEQQEQKRRAEIRHEQDLRMRIEKEHKAQQEREVELLSQMEALRGVQESLALDAAQIEHKRMQLQTQREAELSKLGMDFMGIDLDEVPHAPKLVNLHPDPALKGCLIYYLPVGETSIGSDAERCRVTLAGINISDEVCVVSNEDNERLMVHPRGGGLVRVNGCITSEAGCELHDGDRLAIGRAHIFQVYVPLEAGSTGARAADDGFERAMEEISAGAEVDPQWENSIQKAMMLVKSDFGSQAANKLLSQAKQASEACAMANGILQQMPENMTDGVKTYELSIMFDAHGLPQVCVVARRELNLEETNLFRGGGQSAGIWTGEQFWSERLPAMYDVLTVFGLGGSSLDAESSGCLGLECMESHIWGELSLESYKSLVVEIRQLRERLRVAEEELSQVRESADRKPLGLSGWFKVAEEGLSQDKESPDRKHTGLSGWLRGRDRKRT